MKFANELNEYQRELTTRTGELAAVEARREMEAHLEAAYEARVEIGLDPEEARVGALASVGSLQLAARAEPVDLRDRFLLISPALFLLAYTVQAILVQQTLPRFTALELFQPNVLVAGPALLSMVAAVYGARGRTRPHLRPLLLGWLGAFATAPLLILLSRSGIFSPLSTMTMIGFWLGGPAILAQIGAILLSPMASREREPHGAFALRLLAWPLGMLIVGHATVFSPFVPAAWVLTGSLLMLSMISRRRVDFATAAASTVLGALANGQLESILAGYFPSSPEAVKNYALWFVMLVILQAVAIAFWSLLRTPARGRRIA